MPRPSGRSGIELNPGSLTPGELRDEAWRPIEPYFEERLSALLDAYREARGHGRGSERLEEIAAALAQSRVGTLLVEPTAALRGASMPLWVRSITQANGAATDPAGAARMPATSGAAAVFRY